MIFIGAVIAGIGSLWAGYGQDRVIDYLSGGDSYGFFVPLPVTSKSLQFTFNQHGDTPLYDVLADAIDVTKWKKLTSESGLFPQGPKSEGVLRGAQLDKFWEIYRQTRTTLNIGNVGPGAARVAWEAPIPDSDDQRYEFAIWARNGLVTEKLLMHRSSSGWVWAWRLERTLPQVNGGKPVKLDEELLPGFPPDKLTWK